MAAPYYAPPPVAGTYPQAQRRHSQIAALPPGAFGAPQPPLFIFGHAPQAGGYLPCFTYTDRLHSESVEGPMTLRQGQMLFSANKMFYLILRDTGDLAVCTYEHHQVWTNPKGWFSTRGDPPYSLVMQGDANLVIYDGSNKAVWSSKTANARKGHTSFTARMQDDRNFVVYDMNNFVVWSAASNKNQ